MNGIIIDGYTGKIITASQLRQEKYYDAIDAVLSQSSAPQPGGPWCAESVSERIEAMQAARVNGEFYS